jgi:D-3-phosphoglycerate dehydrogenase
MGNYKYKITHVGIHTVEALEPEKKELQKIGAEQVVFPTLINEEDMIKSTRGSDGMIIMESDVSRAVMEASPNCKVILRTGVGVDTIDIEAATDLGIAVVNVPDVWIREVANHALALILACNRRLFLLDSKIRSGGWPRTIPSPVGSIHGETIGIIGFGQIGRELAIRVKPLGLKVLVSDPYVEDNILDDFGVERVPLNKLLEISDYVSLHTPLTDETCHIIDENALKKMKSNSYVINTARGPVVDNEALAKALSENWIAGAGIDVFEQEPPKDNPLIKLDNVILTSHAAYYSDPALEALAIRCGQEVARVLTGHVPMHLVNKDVLSKLKLK